MSAIPPLFSDSIPEDYDTYLGPFLFESFAQDLASRMVVEPGGVILETACGTGVSTEYLRRSTGAGISIVATDVSEPMLEHARARRSWLEGVSFERADAAALPFEEGSFHAVAQQSGLMFMPDKLEVLREAHRVLRPGGQLVFNVWDDLASNPFVQVAQDAIESFFDEDPPQFLYLPWSYHEHELIGKLMVEAGFADFELHTVAHVAERPSAREVATGLVRGNPTILDVRARANGSTDDVIDAVTEALGRAFGSDPFRAPMQAIVVTAGVGP